MAFENLSINFRIYSKLRGKGRLSELMLKLL